MLHYLLLLLRNYSFIKMTLCATIDSAPIGIDGLYSVSPRTTKYMTILFGYYIGLR